MNQEDIKRILLIMKKIQDNMNTINTTNESNAQIQQQLQEVTNDLKAKTTDLSLSDEAEKDIERLITKLDKVSKEKHEVVARLKNSDVYNIAETVTKNLESALESDIKKKIEKDADEINKATNDLKNRLTQLDKQLDQTKKHKKWFITAFIAMMIFSAVMIVFTSLANMPFLEHAYTFIATKIEHSKTWYVTGLWYLAYLITPMFWIGIVTGVAHLLHRWYTD